MVFVYFIPDIAFLIAFLLMLLVCDTLVSAMSLVTIIFIIVTMLCPVLASTAAMISNYEKGILNHKGAAITIMTVTSVISTVILFIVLQSINISVEDGLSGLINGISDISGMILTFFFLALTCCIDSLFFVENKKATPIKIAINHVMLTIGTFVILLLFIRG